MSIIGDKSAAAIAVHLATLLKFLAIGAAGGLILVSGAELARRGSSAQFASSGPTSNAAPFGR
jgi:hypothetical protein